MIEAGTNEKGMVKVRLRDITGSFVETSWAKPIRDDLYSIENSPFFAYAVSFEDVVEARTGADDVLEYVRCVKKSGNKTVRIIFQQYTSDDPRAQAILRGLRELRCSYEGMQPRMISVNVPPDVALANVTDYLNEQRGMAWEYADPTYEQLGLP
jgi:hypothetical protein